jgi:hypothetical protein
MATDLKKAYRTIMDDHFTPDMEISFIDGDNRQTLSYEKVSWVIGGEKKYLNFIESMVSFCDYLITSYDVKLLFIPMSVDPIS